VTSRSVSTYTSSSVANTRASSPTMQSKRQRSPSPSTIARAQRIGQAGSSQRLVSPDSSPSSRVTSSKPPWAADCAPRSSQTSTIARPQSGSLLDQMLEAQSVSSRADSPDSDGTIGPGNQGMVIPITSSEGSVGGSPPSSDSDRPSVAVPHSARKHVRRPLNYASADQDDETASEYSVVTTSSAIGSTAPATRSTYRITLNRLPPASQSTASTPRPVRALASVPRGIPAAGNSNTIPLGTRVASGASRVSEASSSTSTGFGGFKWHQGTPEANSPAAKRRELSVSYPSSIIGIRLIMKSDQRRGIAILIFSHTTIDILRDAAGLGSVNTDILTRYQNNQIEQLEILVRRLVSSVMIL